MRRFLIAGLVSLALFFVGTSSAQAGDYGFNVNYHASGSFGLSFSTTCGGYGYGGGDGYGGGAYGCGGKCDPYAKCAYAPYFQYGWPQTAPVYPGVAPGYGFAPTPWVLPPSPYSIANPPPSCAPYYWGPR